MSLWSYLFGPGGPAPFERVDDPVFGPLVWSDDEDSWVGEYGGYKITIAQSDLAAPAPELLAHVRNFVRSSAGGSGGFATPSRNKATHVIRCVSIVNERSLNTLKYTPLKDR